MFWELVLTNVRIAIDWFRLVGVSKQLLMCLMICAASACEEQTGEGEGEEGEGEGESCTPARDPCTADPLSIRAGVEGATIEDLRARPCEQRSVSTFANVSSQEELNLDGFLDLQVFVCELVITDGNVPSLRGINRFEVARSIQISGNTSLRVIDNSFIHDEVDGSVAISDNSELQQLRLTELTGDLESMTVENNGQLCSIDLPRVNDAEFCGDPDRFSDCCLAGAFLVNLGCDR